MKRLFALILAVAMLLSMASVGFAECTHTNTHPEASSNNPGYHNVVCDDCNQGVGTEACAYDQESNTKCKCGASKPAAPGCQHENTEIRNVAGTDTHAEFCEDCDEQVSEAVSCTFGEWVMKAPKDGEGYRVCSICGNQQNHDHDDGEWRVDVSDPVGHHATYCTVCDKWLGGWEEHEFNCLGVCTVCGYEDADQAGACVGGWLVEGSDCVRDDSVLGHYFTCKVCHKKIDSTIWLHSSWSETELSEKAELKSDKNGHWYICKECGGIFGVAKHTASDWNKTVSEHQKICTICGYVMESGAHNYAKPATCKDSSSPCTECGYIVLKKAHDYSKYVADGDEHYLACTMCGEEKSSSRANHSGTEFDKDGLLICAACGIHYAADHTHFMIPYAQVDPTCTEKGTTAYQKCNKCDYTIGEKKDIPSLHDQGDCLSWVMVNPGDCEHAATYQLTCRFYSEDNKCLGDDEVKLTYAYVDVDGKKVTVAAGDANKEEFGMHKWDAGKTVAADCCNNAYTVYTCSKCDKTKVVVKADSATGHDLVKKTIKVCEDKADKCILQEIEYYECKNCGCNTYNKSCALERAEYDFGDQITTTKVTKNDIFAHDTECEGKGNKVINTIEKASGHKYTTTTEDRGCAQGKWTIKTCSNCGYKTETQVPNTAGEHAPLNQLIMHGSYATCTENGLYYLECPFCHKHLKVNHETKVVSEITDESGYEKETAGGHNFVEDTSASTNANCTEYATKTYKCSKCNLTVKLVLDGKITADEKAYYDEKKITSETSTGLDADNHDMQPYELIYGSDKCGETGWYRWACSRCGKVDYDMFYQAKNEHNFVLNGAATVAPSCKGMSDGGEVIVKGEGKLICTKCGETKESKDLVKDLGLTIAHKWSENKIEFAATCDKAARKAYVCANCGDEKDVETTGTKLDHKFTYVVTTDCTKVAPKLGTCSLCGAKEIIDVSTDTTITGLKHGKTAKVVLKEKTCLEDGEFYEYCTVCGQYVDAASKTVTERAIQKETAKGSHTWGEVTEVKETCVNGGYKTHSCTVCGETETYDKKDAIKNPKAGLNGGHKEWVIKEWKYGFEGSCTQDGDAMYYCPACGKTGADYDLGTDGWQHISAGHQFPANTTANIKNVLRPATCKETGLGTTVCSRCGVANDKLLTIPKTTNHVYGFETVKSTNCETPDITYYYCKVCHAKKDGYKLYLGLTTGYDYAECIVSLGAVGEHKFDTTEKRESTCTEQGGTYDVCSICGYAKLDTTKTTTAALAHKKDGKLQTVTKVVTEPTCIQEGKRVTTCLLCGEITKEETIAKKNHVLEVNKEKSYAGNCITKGYTVKTCTNPGCAYEITTANDNYGDHVYVTTDTWKTADCATKTPGIIYQVCKYHSDKTICKIIDWNTTHDWSNVTVTKEATCTEAGSKTATCSKCGATTIESIKALGHTWATRNVAATCLKGSYIETYCTVCGYAAASTEPTGVALGHDMMALEYVEPTCEKNGYWASKCSRCDHEVVEDDTNNPAPALGHDWVLSEKVAPTCVDNGYDIEKCSRCDKTRNVNSNKTENQPTGKHTWQPINSSVKMPVCGNTINVYAMCSVCGTRGMQTITGEHNFVGPLVSADNKAIYNACTLCGKIELLGFVNGFDGFDGCMKPVHNNAGALTGWEGAHTLAGGIVTDATCEEAGNITVLYCTKCNTVIAAEAEIAAKGHTVVEVAEVPATCTEDGVSAYSYCSVCNKVLEEKKVLPASHKLVVDEAAVEATCTEAGKTAAQHCENCDYVEESKEVPAMGHKEVVLPAVAPTETETGLTEGKKCETCGEILVAQEVVEAKSAKLIVPAIMRATGEDNGRFQKLFEQPDTEVKILVAANENGYYKVEVAGTTGYMHKSYIEVK